MKSAQSQFQQRANSCWLEVTQRHNDITKAKLTGKLNSESKEIWTPGGKFY